MGDKGKHCVELLEAETQTWNNVLSYIVSAAQKCAVQLGIPDIIHNHGKPMSLTDLIATLPIHASKATYIHRLTRFLVQSGVLSVSRSEEEESYYSLTRAGRFLVKDDPMNSRAILYMNTEDFVRKPFYSWCDWFKNDDPSPFFTAHGENFWDYLAHETMHNDVLNEAMATDSMFIKELLLSSDNKNVFDGITSLVDVAGGTGTLASAISKCFPAMKCIVLDLPQVVASMSAPAASIENVQFVAGNMFEKIPTANAVLLKWILHNWNDEECVRILKKCKEAIPSREEGAKVIIIDIVMEEDCPEQDTVESNRALMLMDITMMVMHGSKERNKKQWEKLFFEAGFSGYQITPTLGLRSLIQLFP